MVNDPKLHFLVKAVREKHVSRPQHPAPEDHHRFVRLFYGAINWMYSVFNKCPQDKEAAALLANKIKLFASDLYG